jgi:hypothetical protein
MPVLVKAEATQKLPYDECPRAARKTFHQWNATGEPEVDCGTTGPAPRQSALRNLRSQRFNLP